MAKRIALLILGALSLSACGDGGGSRSAIQEPAEDVLAAHESAGAASLTSGRAVYQEFCASCHDSGLHDAPVTGRAADWDDRSRLWQAVLMAHAKAGYLEMPAKGGETALSDLDVSQAAEYMLLQTYPEKLPD